jgi:hypothetical protein
MYKTRKHKSIRKKTVKRHDAELQDAILTFDHHTEWDQVFRSDKDRQSHLQKYVSQFRKSVDKYIQARVENIQHAIITDRYDY